MKIDDFRAVQQSQNDSRFVGDSKSEGIRATHTIGQNKAVVWLASKLIPSFAKERQAQNVEIRAKFAEAIREQYGALIGEGFAADIKQGGNKPLTGREIKQTIENADNWTKATKQSVRAKSAQLAGLEMDRPLRQLSDTEKEAYDAIDSHNRASFASAFEQVVVDLKAESSTGQLHFSDFTFDQFKRELSPIIGAVNVSQPDFSELERGLKHTVTATSIQKEKITGFINDKMDLIGKIKTDDPTTRVGIERAILRVEGMSPGSLKVVEECTSSLASAVDAFAKGEITPESTVKIFKVIHEKISSKLQEKGIEAADDKNIKRDISANDVLFGTVIAVIHKAGLADDSSFKNFLESRAMLEIDKCCKSIGNQAFEELAEWSRNDKSADNKTAIGTAVSLIYSTTVKNLGMPETQLEDSASANEDRGKLLKLSEQNPRIVNYLVDLFEFPPTMKIAT